MNRIRVRTWLPAVALLAGACSAAPPSYSMPSCPPAGGGDVLILMAQSVPSAAQVPCIQEFPVGWSFGGQNIETGHSDFWLDSDRGGDRAVTVTLTASCDVTGAVEGRTEADEAGMRRYEAPEVLVEGYRGNRYYVFPGGCIRYRFEVEPPGDFALAVEATDALAFISRADGVKALAEEGLILCGAGVDCPG